MRIVFFTLGCIFLVIGIAGYFVPVLPGTINLILAAGFFGRSSPRVERWLINHPRLGPTVRDWRAEGSISGKHKALAVGMMWVSAAFTCWFAPIWVTGITIACIIGATIYIVSRPTRMTRCAAADDSANHPYLT